MERHGAHKTDGKLMAAVKRQEEDLNEIIKGIADKLVNKGMILVLPSEVREAREVLRRLRLTIHMIQKRSVIQLNLFFK